MRQRPGLVWRYLTILALFCAAFAAQSADLSPDHHASHASKPFCDLCLAAHAPAVAGGGVWHRELAAPHAHWELYSEQGVSVSEVIVEQEASRGPPRRS